MRFILSGGLTLQILGKSRLASGALTFALNGWRAVTHDLHVSEQAKLRNQMDWMAIATRRL